MTQSITILGATGSIGRSTLDVVSRYPERFSVHAVAGGSRVEPLVDVCLSARPKRAVIADASKVVELEQALCTVGLGDIEVLGGPEAVSRLADDPDTDVVVQAVVGAAGAAPTFAAARAGKRLLLANKESVVCGGRLLMETVRNSGCELLPVDSEHNAIFQCLAGATEKARAGARIVLTASGGPFRPRHSAPPHRDSRCGATAQEIYPLKSVMDTLQAILLGIVQGITEFLPVSSSGHLQIAKELLGVELEENLTFDVALHAATVLSTIVVLWSEVWRLLKGLFSRRFNAEQAYVLKLVLSMIPIGVIGFLFKDRINAMLDAPYILVIVGAMLLLTATLLAFAYYAKPRQKETISYRDALIIGLAQACAAMPGLSRSGTTIATGLLLGNKKAAVAQFSFLMVLAPILGETLLEAASGDLTAGIATGTLAAGFAASFITGCLACKFMIEIVKRGKLIWFSLYCALAGLVSILSYFC